jgi:GTP-binding protein Era
MDARDQVQEIEGLISVLKIKVPVIVVLNKMDLMGENIIAEKKQAIASLSGVKKVVAVSANKKMYIDQLVDSIVDLLPEGEPYYDKDELTDLPTKFFAAEIIREKIFDLYEEEIPYQSTVMVSKFEEKTTLIKITAEIVVHRESQKAIMLGSGGVKIKELGMRSRLELEKFLDSKVFLELFVKVRNNWRNNEIYLNEYGY